MENTTYTVTVDTEISVLDLGKAAESIGCVLLATPEGLHLEKVKKRKHRKKETPVMMVSQVNDADNFAPSPDSGVIE